MKIDELIQELEEVKEEHGNLRTCVGIDPHNNYNVEVFNEPVKHLHFIPDR